MNFTMLALEAHLGVYRGAEHHGDKWTECCGFVVLPGSQRDWLILKHGSFDIEPAELGFKTTDQTWHHEPPHAQTGRAPDRLKLPTTRQSALAFHFLQSFSQGAECAPF